MRRYTAARAGKHEAAALLLQLGASATFETEAGETALSVSAMKRDVEMVEVGWCRLTISNPVLTQRLVSARETEM